eukprot:986012-Rhodomonas_salina.1
MPLPGVGIPRSTPGTRYPGTRVPTRVPWYQYPGYQYPGRNPTRVPGYRVDLGIPQHWEHWENICMEEHFAGLSSCSV